MLSKKVLWGVGIVAALAVALFAITGFPPNEDGTEGTIGAAKRYVADNQITDADVLLEDPEIQEILQNDTFQRMIQDDEFRKLLANNKFEEAYQALTAAGLRGQDLTLLGSQEFALAATELGKLGGTDVADLFGSVEFTNALKSQKFRMKALEPALWQAMTTEQFQAFALDPGIYKSFSLEDVQAFFALEPAMKAFTPGTAELWGATAVQEVWKSQDAVKVLAAHDFDLNALKKTGLNAQTVELLGAAEVTQFLGNPRVKVALNAVKSAGIDFNALTPVLAASKFAEFARSQDASLLSLKGVAPALGSMEFMNIVQNQAVARTLLKGQVREALLSASWMDLMGSAEFTQYGAQIATALGSSDVLRLYGTTPVLHNANVLKRLGNAEYMQLLATTPNAFKAASVAQLQGISVQEN